MNDRDLQELLAEISRTLKELSLSIDHFLEKSIPVEVRMEMLKGDFPKDLRKLVDFRAIKNHIIIKPKAFLGKENFGKIADIIRKAGGKYISAGKESHFVVPKR